MIPRILHFVWLSAGETPTEDMLLGVKTALWNTTYDIWIHSNRLFPVPQDSRVKFLLHDFNLDIKGIPFKNETVKYDGKEGKRIAHISDIYRLAILHKYGGIYSDFDVLWFRNAWEFHDKKVVIGYTQKNYKILCNAVMMSEAGHPALIEYLVWLTQLYPCNKYWIPANPYKRWIDSEGVTMIDTKYFYPVKWKDGSEVSIAKVSGSICFHEFGSNRERRGELYDYLRVLEASWPVQVGNPEVVVSGEYSYGSLIHPHKEQSESL